MFVTAALVNLINLDAASVIVELECLVQPARRPLQQ
jgi:hypothetical protein